MDRSRREFIQRMGIALASLMAIRCKLPAGAGDSPRDRLRDAWQRLGELGEEIQKAKRLEEGEEARDRLLEDHQAALEELKANGDLGEQIAEQVQVAFDAAVYHVWRSNAPITCYEAVMIDYRPTSSGQLVTQAKLLAEASLLDQDLDPDTVAMAQAAIARDVAFLNLPSAEITRLYEKLRKAAEKGAGIPSFDDLELDIPPEAAQAADFLVKLLLNE